MQPELTANVNTSSLTFLSGGGEMAEQIKNSDWSDTTLGSPSQWPNTLRFALSMLLPTSIPMILFWGEDLACFFNDAFRTVLGEEGKHPALPGKPAKEAWPEAWHTIAPLVRDVMREGKAPLLRGHLLPVCRNSSMEEVHGTFGFSPVRDEQGIIRGVLAVGQETTSKAARFQTVVEQSTSPVVVFRGQDFIITEANQAALKHWNKGREIIGKPYLEVLPEAKEQPFYALLQQVYHNGLPQHGYEQPVYHLKDDSSRKQFYFNFEFEPYLEADGTVSGVMVLATDVTPQVQTKQQLHYRQALLEAQSNAIPDGLLVVDTKGKMLSYNKRFAEIWRMPKSIVEADDDTAALQFAMTQVTEPEAFIDRVTYLYQNTRESAKEEILLNDGRVLERYGNAVMGEDGTCFGWAWYFRDVTEQKAAEKALEESKQRFQAAVHAVQGILWTNNAQGEMQGDQPGWAALTGQTYEEYQGYGWSNAVHPDDAQPTVVAWNEAVRERKTFVFEHRLRFRDGSWKQFSIRAIPVLNNDDSVREWVGVHTDITLQKQAEQALRESEQRFRSIADTAPAFLFIGNLNNRFEYVSKQWIEFTGLTEEELGQGWVKATHPDDISLSTETYQRAFQTQTPYQYEIRQKSAIDGSYHWILWKGVPRFMPDGEFLGMLGIGFDITEQKKAEEALAYQKSVLETVTENTDMALFLMDEKQYCVYMNEAAEKMTGFQLDELKGKQLHYYVHHTHPDGRHYPLEECPIDQALPTQKRMKGEEVFVHKDGSFYLVAFTASPIIIDGKATGTVIEVRNTTEEKKKEQALRENESRFRSLANAMPQLVWIAEANGEVSYYNDQVAQFNGARKLQDDTWAWEGLLHADDLTPTEMAWKKSLASGAVYDIEHRIHMKDGSYRWHLSRAFPLYNDKGEVVKWYGTATDIHEQKTFTENLERLVAERTRELKRSNEDLQQFAHVASHDLKEPVRKVRTFSGRLKEEFKNNLPEKAELYLSKIEKSADRMYEMIDGVLLYSSLDAMRQTSEDVDLNEIIENIQSDLEVLMVQKEAGLHVKPLPTVTGMPILLYQLFYNLINNSLKFSSTERKPQIEIWAEAPDKAGIAKHHLNHTKSYVQIRLQDNGIGFSQSDAEHIFQTFSRLNSKDKYEGTGLGLSLCRKIAERHGGAIYAEGTEGGGATFIILLPE